VTVKGAVLSGQLVDAGPTEAIVWTNVVGGAVSGGDLVKTTNQVSWSAGASSTRALNGPGYVEFTVPATNVEQAMFGLDVADSNQGFSEINYAFYTYAGKILLFEKGSYVGGYVPYAAGDKLRITVDGQGVVRYSKSGVALYTSSQAAVLPLRVDASLLDPGVTVKGPVFSGPLVDLWPTGGTPVNWVNLTGVQVAAANDLVKTATAVSWSAGASSSQSIDGAGYVEFTIPASNAEQAMFGLSVGDTTRAYSEIKYAFYTYAGKILLFENGSYVGGYVPYAAGDKLRITVESGVVKYWQDGNQLLRSPQAASGQLRVDTSLLDPGVTIKGATLGGTIVP
jgi:hypothetical protein